MAITDPYATLAEYKSRISKKGTTDDANITAELLAVSRYLDLRLNRHFSKDATAQARIFDGDGTDKLLIDDMAAAPTEIKVDLDGDYDFADETALTVSTDFWVGPYNADKQPEPQPFEWLLINPSSAALSVWPERVRSVQVTATFGWPAIPGGIREATIAITRRLRDLHEGGAAATIVEIDDVVRQDQKLTALLLSIEDMYLKPKLR